jgi:hypothetical protein
MELKRRFIFHGDAVAIGGRIVRPDDITLDPKCASALTVVGGRTSSNSKGMRFGKWVRFGSASTLAEGLYDNRKQLVALTNGIGRQEDLTATTTVRAELLELVVGVTPQLTVKRLRGSFTANSAVPIDDETVIRSGADLAVDGVAIDGHKLIVELNKTLFREHDTFTKLRRASSDAAFMKEHGTSFLAGATIGGQPQGGRLVEVRGTISCSVVRSIRWSGKPYPGATIDGHVVTVPEFGRIYFGELLISRDSRRLTMMRLALGSPFGGEMACSDVQDNGSWGN